MKKLKTLRRRKKLTQKQLAEKAGLSQSYINELERGKKKNPSVVVLDKLANVLEVSVMELLKNEED